MKKMEDKKEKDVRRKGRRTMNEKAKEGGRRTKWTKDEKDEG